MKVTIREAAHKKGYSLYRVAKIMEINQQTIYSWANMRTQPNYENMEKLCNVLDCTMNDLFRPEKEQKNESK